MTATVQCKSTAGCLLELTPQWSDFHSCLLVRVVPVNDTPGTTAVNIVKMGCVCFIEKFCRSSSSANSALSIKTGFNRNDVLFKVVCIEIAIFKPLAPKAAYVSHHAIIVVVVVITDT